MTKICHLTSVHSWNDPRIFQKQCCSLANAGFEVHLIAPGAPNSLVNGVSIHSVPKTDGRLHRFSKTVASVYKIAVSIDADAYHFHDPELLPVGLLLKMRNKKVIYDAHEDVPRQILAKHYIPSSQRSIISKSFEIFENFVAKRLDMVVTATPHIRDRFLKIGCKATDINNFPRLTEFSEPNTTNGKKDVVCYVGAICATRGITEMVKAVGLAGSELCLAGPFQPLQLQREVSALQGWKNVDYRGVADREMVQEILGSSRAGLVTLHPTHSYVESLPVKMFEYMAAGIPVIASDFQLWRSIIESADCGICVPPLEPEAIADAILWIYSHHDDAERMGRNGRKAVEECYNWARESEKLSSLYHDILSNGR